jgi:hypothetical protein
LLQILVGSTRTTVRRQVGVMQELLGVTLVRRCGNRDPGSDVLDRAADTHGGRERCNDPSRDLGGFRGAGARY